MTWINHQDDAFISLLQTFLSQRGFREQQALIRSNQILTSNRFLHFIDKFHAQLEAIDTIPSSSEKKSITEYLRRSLNAARLMLLNCREHGVEKAFRTLESVIESKLHALAVAPSWQEKIVVLRSNTQLLSSDISTEILEKAKSSAKENECLRAERDLAHHAWLISQPLERLIAFFEADSDNFLDDLTPALKLDYVYLLKLASCPLGTDLQCRQVPLRINSILDSTVFLECNPLFQLRVTELCVIVLDKLPNAPTSQLLIEQAMVKAHEIAIPCVHRTRKSLYHWLIRSAQLYFHRYKRTKEISCLKQAVDDSGRAFWGLDPSETIKEIPLVQLLSDVRLFAEVRLEPGLTFDKEDEFIRAIHLLELVPERGRDLYAQWLLALCYANAFEISEAPNRLDQALASFSELYARLENNQKLSSEMLGNVEGKLAHAYGTRYRISQNPRDLHAAIQHRRNSLVHLRQSEDARPLLEHLGTLLLASYELSRKIQEIDESIQQLAKVLIWPMFNKESWDVDSCRNRLDLYASALFMRFKHLGDMSDLEEAIQHFELGALIGKTPSCSLESALNNLGAALLARYKKIGSVQDLDRSISLHRQAVRTTQTDSSESSSHLNSLAMAIQTKAILAKDTSLLHESMLILKQSIGKTLPNSRLYSTLTLNLGCALFFHWDMTTEEESLRKAIRIFAKLTRHPKQALSQAALMNLANCYRERFDYKRNPHDRDRAIKIFRQYFKAKANDSLMNANDLLVAHRWGKWALERKAFEEAAEAYLPAVLSLRQLIGLQVVTSHKELAISEVRGLATNAHYALVRVGKLAEALKALEIGRTLLMHEALDHSSNELYRLKHSSQLAPLYHQIRDILGRINYWYESPLNSSESSELARTVISLEIRQLETLKDQVRSHEGFGDFSKPFSTEDVYDAAKISPLVYITMLKGDGLATIVWPDRQIEVVPLPNLNEASLSQMLRAYVDANPSGTSLNLPAKLHAMEALSSMLWVNVMSQIRSSLSRSTRACLIPCGMLSIFPFHISSRKNRRKPRKEFAIDEMTISYAPNARSLAVARRKATDDEHKNLLAVGNPFSTVAPPLWDSYFEIEAASWGIPRNNQIRLLDKNATKENILEKMSGATNLHLSCHAKANYKSPTEGYILLANDKRLTVSDIARAQLGKIRLVMLSACESAVPGIRMADEVIGLPTAFLQAGASGVVGTLWSVDQRCALELVVRFYDELQNGASIPNALRSAQRMVRDTSSGEKADYLSSKLPKFQWYPESRKERVFESPYYWGTFIHFGI